MTHNALVVVILSLYHQLHCQKEGKFYHFYQTLYKFLSFDFFLHKIEPVFEFTEEMFTSSLMQML
jgi:hypothetical protein